MIKNTKYILIILFLLTLINKELFCQADEYFPLHKGDYWQYYHTDGMAHYYYDIKVEDVDTLADSAVNYKINERGLWVYYYKVNLFDKSIVYRSTRENPDEFYPRYKFNEPQGTLWYAGELFNMQFDSTGVGMTSWWQIDSIYYFGYGPVQYFTTAYIRMMKGVGVYYIEGDFVENILIGCIINGVKYGYFVDVEDEITPTDYKVTINNYPNPFNNQTIIKYTIPEAKFVNITMYDMLGREIEVLKNEYQNVGAYTIPWTAKGLSSGVYFAVIKYKNQMLTHKILYQK